MSEKNLCQARASARLRQRLRPDRRKEQRHSITLPVKVAGSESHIGQWYELAETVNVSSGGVALRLSRKVLIGDVLYLQVALPARFQINIAPSATFNAYARVRCIEVHEHQQIVRLQFLKKVIHRQTLVVHTRF